MIYQAFGPQGRRYRHHLATIEEDPPAGFYLSIFDLQGRCIADHCQDTLALAMEQAEEKYQIARSAWVAEGNPGDTLKASQ